MSLNLLRELNGISEKDNMRWSEDMHTLLTNMNIAVHKAKENYKKELYFNITGILAML